MADDGLRTERLLLRRWREEDREGFAALNADPRVMEFLPGVLSRAESDAAIDKFERHFEAHGFGLFAAEVDGTCAGFIGLAVPEFGAPFQPAVEIGWRLAARYWGEGLATEGAKAVVGYAREQLGLIELISFTVPANVRSRRVMEKLGMTYDPSEEFDHPGLPKGHPLRRHVLCRLTL